MVGKVATYYAVRRVRAPVITVVASTLLVASNYLVNLVPRGSRFRARNATFRVLPAPAGKYLRNLQRESENRDVCSLGASTGITR